MRHPHLKRTVFDPDTPIDAPENGYELRPSGALQDFHKERDRLTQFAKNQVKIEEDSSVLYGEIRGIKFPMRLLLTEFNYGNVTAALTQQIGVEIHTVHKPFVDPSRPEGYTHRVDAPEPEEIRKDGKQSFEWKTNLYGE